MAQYNRPNRRRIFAMHNITVFLTTFILVLSSYPPPIKALAPTFSTCQRRDFHRVSSSLLRHPTSALDNILSQQRFPFKRRQKRLRDDDVGHTTQITNIQPTLATQSPNKPPLLRRRYLPHLIISILLLTTIPSIASASTPYTATHPSPLPFRPLGTFRLLPTLAELELVFRLFYATLTGSTIGLERSTSDRPAGVRTMALVSLGACAFTLCSIYGFAALPAMYEGMKVDPGRMAANVASGVGFIGAGVITNNRKPSGVYDVQSSVNGLTTAAAIWVAAAVGVASGVGLYFVGGVAALGTITVLSFGRVKQKWSDFGQRDFSVAKKSKSAKSSAVESSNQQKDDMAATLKELELDLDGQNTILTQEKVEAVNSSSKNNSTTVLIPKKQLAEHRMETQNKKPKLKSKSESNKIQFSDNMNHNVSEIVDMISTSAKNAEPKIIPDPLVEKYFRDHLPTEKEIDAKIKKKKKTSSSSNHGKKKDLSNNNDSRHKKQQQQQQQQTESPNGGSGSNSDMMADPLLEKYLWSNTNEKTDDTAAVYEELTNKPSKSSRRYKYENPNDGGQSFNP